MKIEKFEDCEVWQLAKELLIKIYKATSRFPKEETFTLVSQIRRSTLSISTNIAEGLGRYHYLNKINFYYNSRGSLEETKSLWIVSLELGYINEALFSEVRRDMERLGVKINNFIEKTYKLAKSKNN